jgi:hypothetical protein
MFPPKILLALSHRRQHSNVLQSPPLLVSQTRLQKVKPVITSQRSLVNCSRVVSVRSRYLVKFWRRRRLPLSVVSSQHSTRFFNFHLICPWCDQPQKQHLRSHPSCRRTPRWHVPTVSKLFSKPYVQPSRLISQIQVQVHLLSHRIRTRTRTRTPWHHPWL